MINWFKASDGGAGTGPWALPAANGPWWWNAIMLARASYYSPTPVNWIQKVADAIGNGGPDKGAIVSGSGGPTFFWPGNGPCPPFWIWRFADGPGAIIVIRGLERGSQGMEAFFAGYYEAIAPYPGAVHHIWRQYAEEILAVIQSQFPGFLDTPMYFLGHSLGGCVGLLLATKIFKEGIGAGAVKLAIGVASPKAGDVEFAGAPWGAFGPGAYPPYFRFKDHLDPVPALPPIDCNRWYYLFTNSEVNEFLRPKQLGTPIGLVPNSRGHITNFELGRVGAPSEDWQLTTFWAQMAFQNFKIENHRPKHYSRCGLFASLDAVHRGNTFTRDPRIGLCNILQMRSLHNQLDEIEH